MALSLLTTWTNGQVLTHTALNAEFNNIYNNALTLISPLTGTLDANGNRLSNIAVGTLSVPGINFNGSSNTGLYSSATGSVDVTCAGGNIATFTNQIINLRGAMTGNSVVTTGAGLYDHILTNTGAYRFINAAGTTSANYGMYGDSSNNINFDVPAGTDSLNFRFAGILVGWLQSQSAGMGLLFEGESSADHAAPSANGAVIYTKDNGAGKTLVVCRFATGAVQTIATEP